MKTIRWGMIGCGAVTEVKSGPGLYKANNSALVAVTSADVGMTRSFAERHGVSKAYDTTAELLADPEIDAVYIATPPGSHKPLSLEAAAAGKHVCVEKPMALRYAECQEIIDVCAKQNVRLFVSFYRRAMPRFLKVKEWIDSGAIGNVRLVKAVQHRPPAPDDMAAVVPWRLKPEVAGGGWFLDMGIHTLDILDMLFGEIMEVHGIASNLGGLYAVEDTVTATWRHQSGVQGYGSWCYVCDYDLDSIEIIGSKGQISFEFFSEGPLTLTRGDKQEQLSIANPPHVHQPFFQSIVNELNGEGTCPGNVASAARASWVADAILAEYRRKMGW